MNNEAINNNNPLLEKILGEIRDQVNSESQANTQASTQANNNSSSTSISDTPSEEALELTDVVTASGEVVNISNMKKELENKLAREALKNSVFNIIDNKIDDITENLASSSIETNKVENVSQDISKDLNDSPASTSENIDIIATTPTQQQKSPISQNMESTNSNSQINDKTDNTEPLLSSNTINNASQFINNLMEKSHLVTSTTQKNTTHAASLEELLINAMKPELSAWLNNNLPKIVAEIVEKEIKNLVKDANK